MVAKMTGIKYWKNIFHIPYHLLIFFNNITKTITDDKKSIIPVFLHYFYCLPSSLMKNFINIRKMSNLKLLKNVKG